MSPRAGQDPAAVAAGLGHPVTIGIFEIVMYTTAGLG